jgi:hypothetical protein
MKSFLRALHYFRPEWPRLAVILLVLQILINAPWSNSLRARKLPLETTENN